MDDQSKIPMTPFDTLISTPGLRMMKLMIPYLPPSNQRMLAVYVKFMELQQTFSFFQNFRSDLHSCAFEKEVSSPSDILEELRPFLRKSDCEMIDQIQNMLSAMEIAASFQNMTKTSSTLMKLMFRYVPMPHLTAHLPLPHLTFPCCFKECFPRSNRTFLKLTEICHPMFLLPIQTQICRNFRYLWNLILWRELYMNNWMEHPMLQKMDPAKLELIRTAATKTNGKSGNDLAPILLTLITNANKKGIRFSPDEISLILELLKEGKSKEEQMQIDKTVRMASSLLKNRK